MFFNSEGFIAGILPTAQAAYYCRDAQGNITSVWRVDAGYPYQTTHYYADGHIKNNSTGTSFQPYLYSGKELQRMHGYDCYDYGARHSQTTLGRFTTPDPLAERYYDTSPYVLCGGNPVRYVDPDGRRVSFAPGSTPQFKKDVQTAVNHLYKKGAAKIVDRLIKDPKINLTIRETTDENIKYRSNNILMWNPKVGMMTNNGAILSPTTVLNHEFDHALQANTNHEQFMQDADTEDVQYSTVEEKRVIENSEQDTAKKLGEIKENETTRQDHYAIPIITESPISNKPKYEY